ncbi:MAG: (2Fe-2S) ferredoxin domain-containing protein [Rhizobiales bacterium]|nr:(2Fe-2S) ferredoxin domain-containing protein [Hyphomicrobiales bacterium]
MGQYDRHVFVCTSGETCPTQGDTEQFVKRLRAGVQKANRQGDVRVNKAGCFSQCGHGPMAVVYPENVWYAALAAEDAVPDIVVAAHPIQASLTDRQAEWSRHEPGRS